MAALVVRPFQINTCNLMNLLSIIRFSVENVNNKSRFYAQVTMRLQKKTSAHEGLIDKTCIAAYDANCCLISSSMHSF